MRVNVASDRPIKALSGQMNKLLDQMQKGYFGFYPTEQWTPSVNVYETESSYHVCVDLAGVEKKKIDVEVVDQRLTIKGARPVPACSEVNPELQNQRVRVHLMEIDHGSFARDVELPMDVERDKISASYKNGLLWIELPKKA
jgi:HSP20 family protein